MRTKSHLKWKRLKKTWKIHQPFFDVFFALQRHHRPLYPPRSRIDVPRNPLQKVSHEVIDQQDSQDLGEERLTLPFVSCVSLSTCDVFTTKSGKKSLKSSNPHYLVDPQCFCSSHLSPLFEALQYYCWCTKSWRHWDFLNFYCSFGGSQV